MRRWLLPIVALMGAVASTMVARDWLQARSNRPQVLAQTPAKPASKSVLVASKSLGAGEFIQPDGVRWQEWPDVSLPDSYVIEGKGTVEDVVGAVLRRTTVEGEPITQGNIVKPGERGFLAAVLDPGLRAVSVPVDEASSNAGLIFPGDHVDLILTQKLGEEGEAERQVSETVLEDVRVLAMGRRLRNEEGEEASGGQARTATLEVTPAGAEKVALTTELGKLSLSLRSLARQETGTASSGSRSRITWDADVSPVLRPENQPRTTMSVIRGAEAQTVSVARGAGR
jgi:pilus assembly protein CpaB